MNITTQLFIAGFSMGGALGVRLAERHPELVTGLILSNPALLDPHGFMRRISALRFFKATLRPTAGDIVKANPPIHGYREPPLAGLHSIQDQVVSAACSEFILREAKSVESRLPSSNGSSVRHE